MRAVVGLLGALTVASAYVPLPMTTTRAFPPVRPARSAFPLFTTRYPSGTAGGRAPGAADRERPGADVRRSGVAGIRAEEHHFFAATPQDGAPHLPQASARKHPLATGLPKVAFRGTSPVGPSGPTLPLGETLDFLEATPYWDQSGIPINVAKQKGVLFAFAAICSATQRLPDTFRHRSVTLVSCWPTSQIRSSAKSSAFSVS
jgi:hypothetical protein